MTRTKRNLICIAVLLCLCFIAVVPVSLSAYASSKTISSDDFNTVTSIIQGIATAEDITLRDIKYIVNDIYYSNEQWAGYVVDFATCDLNGYAIFFKINDSFTVVEINFDRSSYYIDKRGLFVYPSLGYYYIKVDGKYYDAETMEQLDDYKPTEEPSFYAACNSGQNTPDSVTKTINYKRSTLVSYTIPNFYYQYGSNDSIQGYKRNCANVAGMVALNYWNNYYGNQLLNLPSSSFFEGNIKGLIAGKYIDLFYDYMNTNWFLGIGGTLPNNCYKGFEKLIKENGYQTERIKCKTFTDIEENIDKGIPVFITSKDYYFTTRPTQENLPDAQPEKGEYSSTIYYNRYHGISSAHTFIGYGYASYNLHLDVGVDLLLMVKVADGAHDTCYFNYLLSDVTDAVAIRVYK